MLSRKIAASTRSTHRFAAFARRGRLASNSVEQKNGIKAAASLSSASASSSSSDGYRKAIPVALLSVAVGFAAGYSAAGGNNHDDHRHLPNGLPRTCCDDVELSKEQKELFVKLRKIVGKKNILDGRIATSETSKYLRGSRLGSGSALYIIKPTKIKQIVTAVQEIIDAGCVVLVQGQNTGLTGGSVPRQQADGRPTVIISTQNLDAIFPIDDGKRVVCFPGAGLAQLKNFIDDNFPDRESHSTLGSTFLNPTAAAGIAFGSGGTQCRKGPAYTDRALYLKVDVDKFGVAKLKLVNTLGIKGFDKHEGEALASIDFDSDVVKLDSYSMAAKSDDEKSMRRSNDGKYGNAPASDTKYKSKLCKKMHKVNRYNADTSGCDCNRSEGKVLILASVHDTFPKPKKSKSFWLSFDSLETALKFRSQVCLDNPDDLPVSVEYMDRDSFDVIDESGRILGNLIKLVGPASSIVRTLWNMKLKIEGLGAPLLADTMLFLLNPIMPSVLPSKFMKTGREFDHHIALTAGEFDDGNLGRFLQRMEAFARSHEDSMIVQECESDSDVNSLTAFRFVAAPAFRTWCVGRGVQGFSVDYALPCDGGAAPAILPATPIRRMRYSHFGCNVVHEDLAFPNDVDIHAVKKQLKSIVEHDCHGKLPAEHGHGTEYVAPPETMARWKKMDPSNVMNPGVGGLSSKFKYQEE